MSENDMGRVRPLVVYTCDDCGARITRWWGGRRITDECPECFDGVWSEDSTVSRFTLVESDRTDDQSLCMGMDWSPFDETVEGIATVLDDLPPMQVLRAVQQLAEDPDARMEAGDVRTAAANISSDEDLRSLIGRGESPDSSSTATGGGDGDA